MSKYVKATALMTLVAGAFLVSACATVDGMGKDVEKTGEVISDAAKSTKNNM